MAKVEYRKENYAKILKFRKQPYIKQLKSLVFAIEKNKVPKVTTNQLQRQKKRLSNLRRGALKQSDKSDIIMDDEAYFTLSGMGLPRNVGYYTCLLYTSPSPRD